MFERFKIFVEKYVIQDVPPELEFCEFGCERLACEQGKWDRCPNRIRYCDEEELSRFNAQSLAQSLPDETPDIPNRAA